MNKLKNKVAVVTGASKGIGASIAKYFAAEGAKVVVNYASSKEDADKIISEIIKNGGNAMAVQGDVSKQEDVIRLFDETKNAFGTLNILVNNAGIYNYEPIELVSAETFHQQFNINVLGSIFSIQSALKLFGEKGGNHQYQFRSKQITLADRFCLFCNKNGIRCFYCYIVKRICRQKYPNQFYFARYCRNRRLSQCRIYR